ncbi:MAG: hypothetical protein WBB82_09130 [Limnothrix sp.]
MPARNQTRSMMKFSAVCSTFSLATMLAIAPASIHLPNQLPHDVATAQTARPLTIFVGNSSNWNMPELQSKLQALNSEIWYATDNNTGAAQSAWQIRNATDPSTLFLMEEQYTLSNIPTNRPIMLIGDRSGTNSIFKLLPSVERNIQLVALVDTAESKGSLPVNGIGLANNIGIFLNYFQMPNTTNPRLVSDQAVSCNSAVNCYEFVAAKNAENSSNVDPQTWIQADLIDKIDIALKRPQTVALTNSLPSVKPACENDIVLRSGLETARFDSGKEWQTCTGYRLTFQVDGNIVLYNPLGQAIWSSGTYAPADPADIFALQSDGNAVLYRQNAPVWSTETFGNQGSTTRFQADGNLVIYDAANQPIWATNTSNQ